MLNEPHYPSKWSVVIVFVVLALLMVGVFAWAFYFNVGTVRISADQDFTLSVNGEDHDCLEQSCEVTLVPGSYDFVARLPGYFEEKFSSDISRWQGLEKELSFQLVPFLKNIDQISLPPAEDPVTWFESEGGQLRLMTRRDNEEQFVVGFDSLEDPEISSGGDLAVVVDKGRIFFVDLVEGRRQRRFDDSVFVQAAQVSDNGKRVLLFVSSQELDQRWVWHEGINEIRPQPWFSPSQGVAWDLDSEYQLFVISNQLVAKSQSSLLENLFDESQPTNPTTGLFRYNLDTEDPLLLVEYGEQQPLQLERRADRYFIELTEGDWSELVVR